MSITSTVRRISDSFLRFLPRYFYCLYRYIFVDYTKVNVERKIGKIGFFRFIIAFFLLCYILQLTYISKYSRSLL